jgi:hypothetical protein
MNKKKCSLWTAIICGLLLILPGCDSQPAANITLPELLSHPGCNSSCWQGIEPEITNREQLLQYLEENNIEYTTTPGTPVTNAEYFYWSIGNLPLSSDGEVILVDVAIYVPTNRVADISIGRIDLCVSTVIRDYGLPRSVSLYDSSYVLAYPSQQLMFFADVQLAKVYSFDIRSQQLIEEDFVTRTYPPIPQDGSTIENLISEDCVDQFSR